MSNSKWVKLISKLVENIDQIKRIQFKNIQSDEIGDLLLEGDMEFGFDYWQEGIEMHNSLGGVVAFKEIEWLIFPKIVDIENLIEQDLNAISKILMSVGSFELDVDDNRIKLICYR